MDREPHTRGDGFWADKVPCWVLAGCVEDACSSCVAFHDRARPCWEQETLCKKLLDAESCYVCVVYRLYARRAQSADRGPACADVR